MNGAFTKAGSDQEFFNYWESDLSNNPHYGTLTDSGYYRDFSSMEVVWPVESSRAQIEGTTYVSVDHCIRADGTVDCVVLNRTIEELPGGEKWEA